MLVRPGASMLGKNIISPPFIPDVEVYVLLTFFQCRADPSLMGEKFEGRMLLHLFASCFTEDSYLKVQLTNQVKRAE